MSVIVKGRTGSCVNKEKNLTARKLLFSSRFMQFYINILIILIYRLSVTTQTEGDPLDTILF